MEVSVLLHCLYKPIDNAYDLMHSQSFGHQTSFKHKVWKSTEELLKVNQAIIAKEIGIDDKRTMNANEKEGSLKYPTGRPLKRD